MRPVAIQKPGLCPGQIAVPDLVGPFGHRKAGDLSPARLLEYAQLDLLGVGGIDGEIYPQAVEGGAEGIGQSALKTVRKQDQAAVP